MNRALKILLVEDSPSDTELLQETLQQAGLAKLDLACVERLDSALARLDQEIFDVMLLDLSLPDSTGAETFQRVRRAAPAIPIVVLTGASDESTGLAAVRYGVQDYLVKGQNDGRQITRAIRYAIERTRAEEALRRARLEAEARAADLKAVLDSMAQLDAELRRRNQQLADEARRKDEFLAMLGHELRNPLAPIRNAVYLLRQPGVMEPAREQARAMIDRQVTHLARLVDDLLDVSRITRGQIVLRKERLDLVELLRAVAEDHRPVLESAALSFDVQLPARSVWITADAARISQTVSNLLHNARKFTDPGGSVTLELVVDRETQTAILTCRDTGIGMEPHLRERIFTPFVQLEQSIERSRGGLGLGLALVKGLVELHGGSVQASSAGPERGSEFVVRLALEEAPVPKSAPGLVPSERRPRRILVIEDNLDTACSLRLLLEVTEHRVEVTHGANAGLEKAREFRPEIILCDIGLPGGMDGCAFARAARQEPALKDAYLIAMTGYGQDDDRRRTREAGFDVHLTKPVDPEVLEWLIANARSG